MHAVLKGGTRAGQVRDMSETCPRHVSVGNCCAVHLGTRPGHVRDMSETCPRHLAIGTPSSRAAPSSRHIRRRRGARRCGSQSAACCASSSSGSRGRTGDTSRTRPGQVRDMSETCLRRPDQTLHLYSGHDWTVTPLLLAVCRHDEPALRSRRT
ncbi:hypothetical protein EMIHUDRAFT_439233 [Emiliania huxleyi CCMP1516]|uniref:Uncharacterized protein n=2 Tax=Emiliania huxleyi TaxID=2903 RepID=A0A0D3HYZ6_EMIH1|nr:hypothetical protein EMIHUDRAFT_439233 [Emiliania huxleyi CCMP1516]EOD04231.1 hypothetical protein EMIHUDRAFT_439233 [Emiliania huxleyi CCMP1516]|eukprot:XP_005756660.1 hypothetical protein EMIHUDRAFT_439233 [Emiliania huxleyi CCMP1516]